MTTRNIVELPEDLVVEIFSRVPTVSLVRLRSTSKALNALIKDERFAKKHSTNAPKQSPTIMLIASRVYLLNVDFHKIHNDKVKLNPKSHFSLKDPLSNSSKEVDIREIFHCDDGLLLCTTKDNRLVVWNPCTSEIKWIQPRDSYKKYDIFALGKSSCNKYKILRMDQVCYCCTIPACVYEIYDFTSSSWRVVGKTSDWFIPLCQYRGMSVNGNTYSLAYKKSSSDEFLLCFDFSTERFASVSLPGDHLSYIFLSLSVTREDQKLCLLVYETMQQEQNIDVWIATKIESAGTASWSKFLSLSLAHFGKRYYLNGGMNFLVDQESKLIVFCGKNGFSNIFVYVMGEDKCIHVDLLNAKSRCSLVVSYIPSLVQIQQV